MECELIYSSLNWKKRFLNKLVSFVDTLLLFCYRSSLKLIQSFFLHNS